MTRFRFASSLAVGIATVAALAGARLLSDRLTVNGKTSPIATVVVGGSTYVKLADVAKALDMVVVKTGEGQFEFSKPGGANQINGLQGKIGDTLFDGKWRFTVVSVDSTPTYKMKSESEPYGTGGQYIWDRTTRLLQPSPGYTLYVVQCRISNGVNAKRTLWTAISDDRIHTALTDNNGMSYVPIGYDFPGAPTQTEPLLPGSKMTFPMFFSIPEGTKIQDLVVTLKNNQGDDKGIDVRVSLDKS